jgi:hypothetical protein
MGTRGREHGLAFLRRLAGVRVLDPACGTGNFLVVAFTLLREFEEEVARALGVVGARARCSCWGSRWIRGRPAVAELVLQIAYLQAGAAWRHRIELGDALIVWDERRARVDDDGASR